ncbi:hypothetical protein SAMN04487896_3316 [Paenibacillus sp. ov031]|uniref:hypothetical protein n=1 Tax=Paenibacillus sp. ov031 TaxID=1761879 RepID=UPI0009196CC6|nr:hypothetical protein [Paenibacillus sp. ov031]SHN73834.1 hypothetical protein SAMN04487896_3316 [Paenibacillus sp. ov031]
MPEHLAKSPKSLKHILPWKAGVLTGLTSGLVLGFFLKALQTYTGEKVYTLLLNIDFVPWLPPTLPEYIEFVLHLIVSIIIGNFYIWWIQRSGHPISKGVLIGALSSLLYIPLSQLSSRVPDLYDIKAILYWLTGHLLFGVVVGWCGHVWKHSQKHNQKGDPPFRHE